MRSTPDQGVRRRIDNFTAPGRVRCRKPGQGSSPRWGEVGLVLRFRLTLRSVELPIKPILMFRWLVVVTAIQWIAGCAGGTRDAAAFDSSIRPTHEFPLHVSADGASLLSDAGSPFYIHGEAAWSLIVQTTIDDAQVYLADRQRRGINTILVNLIEHKFSDQPPANVAGDAPFTTAGDLSTPNEAYFAHADRVIDLAAAHGIAVMLFPSYLGVAGGDEGWFSIMSRTTPAKCRSYGDYVGKRYAPRNNIIWIWGGDFTPPAGSAGERCMKAIADGIRTAAPQALASAHWNVETTSRDEPTFAGMLDLVGVYSYVNGLAFCQAARTLSPKRPTFLIETTYENERGVDVPEIRAQQWRGAIGCGAGEISGNNPIWRFGSGWQAQLNSPLSAAQARLRAITTALRVADLGPDETFVTTGRGTGSSEIAVARTADGAQAIAYFPPNAAPAISIDLSPMAAPVTATWHDPTANAKSPAGSGLAGRQWFSPPGANASGSRDWVLVLRAGG